MVHQDKMSILQKIQMIAQMIGVAGLLTTLLINYRQVRLVNLQMQEMRRSTTAQHILSLLNFIESDEIRAALNLVYTTLHKTRFTDWTEDQLQAASKVCTSFSTAGTILQSGLVPLEPLIVGWEPTLMRCYQVLEPYIREMQKPENAGPQYWAGFDWLYSQVGSRPEQAPAVEPGQGHRRRHTEFALPHRRRPRGTTSRSG
jgi:hypothetical protein